MKKKILLSTLLILITSLPLMAFTMEIAPYEGAFGVPLGSPAYDGGDNGFEDATGPNANAGKYSDSEIVAIAEFQDIKESDVTTYGQEVKITVSCPDGMFFVSQSNPAFKFPFELQLIWTDDSRYDVITWEQRKEQYQDYDLEWYDNGTFGPWSINEEYGDTDDPGQEKEWYKINGKNGKVDNDHPERKTEFYKKISIDPNSNSNVEITGTRDGNYSYDYPYRYRYFYNQTETYSLAEMDLWADIVLVLPGTVNTANDTVTYNNVVYPLIEADDYTALVTITMEYGGQIKSITIPFSGFYEKDNTVKEESVCSLLVDPYSTAAHLNIEQDRGKWIPVGSLDFMLSTATNTNTKNPVIFASSNRDPEAINADEFRLVHESATFNTPLTQTNSIGFDVRIRNLNADGGTASYIFDGTATLKSVADKLGNLTYGTDSGNNQYPSSGDWGGIVPAKIYSKLQHDNAEKSYYLYNGEIEVMMDPGTNVMLEGRYTGTVYIHVIADETRV